MTAAQHTVLETVAVLAGRDGRPPTVREVQRHLGYATPSTPHGHLEALRREGLVTWVPGGIRTLAVTAAGREALGAA